MSKVAGECRRKLIQAPINGSLSQKWVKMIFANEFKDNREFRGKNSGDFPYTYEHHTLLWIHIGNWFFTDLMKSLFRPRNSTPTLSPSVPMSSEQNRLQLSHPEEVLDPGHRTHTHSWYAYIWKLFWSRLAAVPKGTTTETKLHCHIVIATEEKI